MWGLLYPQGGGLKLQRDDQINGESCDNISAKNGSYCELTAMYWAWKNIKKLYPNLEYIGLNHYRRYFSFDERSLLYDVIERPACELKNYKFKLKKAFYFLKKGYSIVSELGVFPYSLWINACIGLPRNDLMTLRRVVHDIYPEYDEAFYEAILRRNTYSHFNMAIMKWNDFDAYCTWLFNIMFEVEKRIDISRYKGNVKRIFGYIGENIFNVWALKNNIKLKKVKVVRYDDDFKNRSKIKQILYLLICFVTGSLLRPFHKHISNWNWLDENL